MNIATGKRIHGYNFTELAMPAHVLDHVHSLAELENAPDLDSCSVDELDDGGSGSSSLLTSSAAESKVV